MTGSYEKTGYKTVHNAKRWRGEILIANRQPVDRRRLPEFIANVNQRSSQRAVEQWHESYGAQYMT